MTFADSISAAAVDTFATIGRLGTDPQDSDSERIRKTILLSTVILAGIPALLSYGLLYAFLGEYAAAAVALCAGTVMILTMLFLRGSAQRFSLVVFINLSITLLAAFLLALSLGGLVNSGFVLIWGLVAPLLAILQYTTRQAFYWLGALLLCLLVCVLVQPLLPMTNNIPFVLKNVLAALNMAGLSLLVFVSFVFFVHQRDLAYQFLEIEQGKSERLLLNILPMEVAAKLKDQEGIVADQFDGASILFADVVEFTPMSAGMTPTELVELLNDVFSYFDSLVERYDLEKIKTIGDCYMVAAGVPRPRPDHAAAITRMALEMRDYVQNNTFCGHKLTFRIGINSGPVVAGVIGRKKFIYDLWGDAVNTASRMEANGRSGMIQITAATQELIKDVFDCQSQGTIPVKGKGDMAVWYVMGELGPPAAERIPAEPG